MLMCRDGYKYRMIASREAIIAGPALYVFQAGFPLRLRLKNCYFLAMSSEGKRVNQKSPVLN